ncbi:MAG: sugar phosphate isomerase/epimerase family protein [Bacteroidota bacterium]
MKKRKFLKNLAGGSAGIAFAGLSSNIISSCAPSTKSGGEEQQQASVAAAGSMFFKISLAEWSLHKALQAGEMTNLDFIKMARTEFGIGAVEYVNQFFKDKAQDKAYLAEMNKIAADNDVKNVLIMIDGEGSLGASDDIERTKAIENHYRWVEAAKELGCHSIRVNARGSGSYEEIAEHAVDGLSRLAEFAKGYDIGVIVENHGGPSSNGEWLAGVMSKVNMPNCGTLPDFGNFCIERAEGKCVDEYDRYKGVTELMPYAKGVSAKSHDFNSAGQEINTDYLKMLQIVKAAGYTGYVGIEYEGSSLGEKEGILATKALLEQVAAEIS